MRTKRRDDRIITKELNVETKFEIAGVQVTATAAEINAMAGAGLSASELGFLNGVAAGTVTASKALVVGADKELDELHLAALYLGAAAGTQVTASAAELNLIDGSVAGTAVVSKAAVLGANKNLDEFHTAALYLGAGAGTLVSASAAELNLIDGSVAGTAVASKAAVLGANNELDTLAIADGGLKLGSGAGTAVTSTANELNTVDGAPLGVASLFTIGAEAGDVINVGVQLKDANGADLAVRGSVEAYLSDDANGDSVVATAPDGGWAIGTDGVLIPIVASKVARLISEADGDIDINITHAGGAKTVYLIIVLPNGKLVASGAITFGA